jgi:hypothetical protein
VEAALLEKGMSRDEKHHHMYRKTIQGVTHVVTRISHSADEIDDYTGGLMAKQLCLRLQEFWRLVDCPLRETEWDRLIAERCADGRNPFLGR